MVRRVLVVLAVISGLAGVVTALPPAANAAPAPSGGVRTAVQDTFAHRLNVRGWADDPARPHASITVTVRVDGRFAGEIRANARSRHLNASRGFAGRHDFALHVRWTPRAHVITLSTHGVHPSGPRTQLGHLRVRHVQPPPGTRIVSIAKPFVGRARYTDGGASPRTGFDCSGYTQWVFAHAHVASLPHNAEAQRHAHGMRQISVQHARPGDLVFYMSGGGAYHVAIYAGHGMQYAAATPRDGIRYQAVWSRAVQYRTDWH
jgi:cell wall-associated NlpC family hydrolase